MRFVNVKAHPVDFLKQIVWKLDIGLVDFVDQQNGQLRAFKCFPKLSLLNVVANVVDAFIAQLAVAQAGNGIIFIQALMRFGRGLNVPGDQRGIERLGYFFCQHGFTSARFTLHEKGASQRSSGIHCDLQVVSGDIGLGAFKAHRHFL